jgi:arylsulfatase A-like enzyme
MRTVFVLYDSLNRLALECFGGAGIPTPNFNRFAEKAVSFDRHYVGSLPCMPARRDLMTGRLGFMHRSWGPLEPFDNTFAQLLSAQGTYSHMITDHQHYFQEGGFGYINSFDSWEFIRGQEDDTWVADVQPPLQRYREMFDDRHYPLSKIPAGTKTVTKRNVPDKAWKQLSNIKNRERYQQERDFPCVKVFSAGLDFLQANRQADDWFLMLETFDPHEPFHAPERFRKMFATGYNGKILDWPIYEKITGSAEEVAEIRANYAALVAMCDDQFGRLLDTFDALDLWADTALIVATDHGFLLSEHDWWGKNRTPYYDEISHIPLMIYHPDHAQSAGQRRQSLTQAVDLMPTFLDMASGDIACPAEVTGHSLMPVLADDSPVRQDTILGMFGGPICATDGRYTYYLYPDSLTGEGFNEYTLMPAHLRSYFDVRELADMEMSEPFDFTKNARLMKIKARDFAERIPWMEKQGGFAEVGTVLYDLANDPQQMTPLTNPEVVQRMRAVICRHLLRHDAPREIYQRYGLSDLVGDADFTKSARDGV